MTTRNRLRALVIDDSALSRQTLTRMLESSPLIEVVGWAGEGASALRKTLELEPDFITLDLEMPGMDGFTFLRLLMARRPTPVVVVSGHDGQADVFKALELGAVDFVAKPQGASDVALDNTERELIRKVLGLRELAMDKVRERIATPRSLVRESLARSGMEAPTVLIGASTGGPTALSTVLSAFSDRPPFSVLIAQHMPAGFTTGFAERLDRMTPFEVREARAGDAIEAGRVLIAPGGHHLELSRVNGRVETRITPDEEVGRNIPCINRLFQTAAKELGDRTIAVVLTGMGDDGTEGARAIRDAGGAVIAESEETAVIYGMPKQVAIAGLATEVKPLPEMADAIQLRADPLK